MVKNEDTEAAEALLKRATEYRDAVKKDVTRDMREMRREIMDTVISLRTFHKESLMGDEPKVTWAHGDVTVTLFADRAPERPFYLVKSSSTEEIEIPLEFDRVTRVYRDTRHAAPDGWDELIKLMNEKLGIGLERRPRAGRGPIEIIVSAMCDAIGVMPPAE